MRKLFALLLAALLALGLVAAPSAQAATLRWSLCYSNGIGGCTPHGVASNVGWHVGTSTDGGNYMAFQSDCNLVIYSKVNGVYRAAWASNSVRYGSERPCALRWQGDGNTVIYDAQSIPLWATGTNQGTWQTYSMQFGSNNCLQIWTLTRLWSNGLC